jgi:hypothetical protein
MSKVVMNLIIIIFAAFICNIPAQTDSFTILAVQGKVLLSKNKPVMWSNLKIGDRFSGDSKIKLSKDSYAGMIYSNGTSIELHQPGIYDCSTLKSLTLNTQISSNKKFMDFVLKELSKKIDNPLEMKVTGAVVRGRINYIAAGMPFNTCIIDPIVNFKWYPDERTDYYNFKILDGENRTLYIKKLQDTSITININLFNNPGNSCFKWIVSNYEKLEISSDTNYIIKFTQLQTEAIKDSVEQLNEILGKEQSALNQIILAEFYQRNNLNIDALNGYKKAVSLAPKVKIYSAMFKEFLNKVDLTRIY